MGAFLSQIYEPIPPGHFQPHRTFPGHTRPINCIRFSPDGSLLASGGDDACVRIWSMRGDGACVQTLRCSRNGPVTDLRWNAEGSNLLLIFGCADGMVHIYHRSSETGAEFKGMHTFEAHSRAIEAIDYDPARHRLATAAGGAVKVWAAPAGNPFAMKLVAIEPSQGYVARSVHFVTGGRTLIATFLDTHEVWAWSIEPWKPLWCCMSFTRIGNAALSYDGEHLLVDNLATGIDTYSVPHMVRKATYNSPTASRRTTTTTSPKQVCFAARDNLVVQGSDCGVVYVYDFASAELFQTLQHHVSPTALVQTVASYSGSGMHFIAGGLSDEDYSIKIWCKPKKKTAKIQQTPSAAADPSLGWVGVFIVVVLIFVVLPGTTIFDGISLFSKSSPPQIPDY